MSETAAFLGLLCLTCAMRQISFSKDMQPYTLVSEPPPAFRDCKALRNHSTDKDDHVI